VVDDKYNDRADDGDDQTVDVEPRYADTAERVEDEAANDRADDAEHHVENQPLTLLVDELAGDETGDQAQNEPCNDTHMKSPLS
jgi:hypothetical protein